MAALQGMSHLEEVRGSQLVSVREAEVPRLQPFVRDVSYDECVLPRFPGIDQ